jgi:hypothetical protein
MLYIFRYCIFTDLLMLLNPRYQSPPRILWHNVSYLRKRSTYGGWEGFSLLLSEDTNDKHLYIRWGFKSVFSWWMTLILIQYTFILSTELELSINIKSHATCDTAKLSGHWWCFFSTLHMVNRNAVTMNWFRIKSNGDVGFSVLNLYDLKPQQTKIYQLKHFLIFHVLQFNVTHRKHLGMV